MNPFITAYQNDAMEQLEGQVASAKIVLSRLASPQLYWVLAGKDFKLDINIKGTEDCLHGKQPRKTADIRGCFVAVYFKVSSYRQQERSASFKFGI
jgi:hypothetical protein